MRISPPTIEEFAFHVELWSDDNLRVHETLAVARNIRVATAAYEEAVRGQEGRIVKLRHGARVILPA